MKLFKKEAYIGVPSRILKFVDETNAFTRTFFFFSLIFFSS